MPASGFVAQRSPIDLGDPRDVALSIMVDRQEEEGAWGGRGDTGLQLQLI